MTDTTRTDRRLEGITLANIPIAENPELLRELRGSPMTVYMALAMYMDDGGQCFPGVETICKDTGYTKKTVLAAMTKLEEAGLLARQRRYQTSNLYTLTNGVKITPPPPPASSEVVKSIPPQAQNRRKVVKITPEDVVVYKGPINKRTLLHRVEKVQPEFKQLELEGWSETKTNLATVFNSEKTAEKLVSIQREKGRTPEWVKAALDYFNDVKSGKKNPLGWLFVGLTGDVFNVPTSYLDMLKSNDPKRFIAGEYADIVEW